MKSCPNCRNSLMDEQFQCDRCGMVVSQPFCFSCRAPIENIEDRFCTHCGAPFSMPFGIPYFQMTAAGESREEAAQEPPAEETPEGLPGKPPAAPAWNTQAGFGGISAEPTAGTACRGAAGTGSRRTGRTGTGRRPRTGGGTCGGICACLCSGPVPRHNVRTHTGESPDRTGQRRRIPARNPGTGNGRRARLSAGNAGNDPGEHSRISARLPGHGAGGNARGTAGGPGRISGRTAGGTRRGTLRKTIQAPADSRRSGNRFIPGLSFRGTGRGGTGEGSFRQKEKVDYHRLLRGCSGAGGSGCAAADKARGRR